MPLILFLVWLFLKVPAIMRSILSRKNQRLQKHEWLGLFLGDLSDSVLVFSSSFLLPVSNRAKWEKFVPNRLISKHPFNNASVKIFNSFQKAHFFAYLLNMRWDPTFCPLFLIIRSCANLVVVVIFLKHHEWVYLGAFLISSILIFQGGPFLHSSALVPVRWLLRLRLQWDWTILIGT